MYPDILCDYLSGSQTKYQFESAIYTFSCHFLSLFFLPNAKGGGSVFHTHFHYVYNFAIFVFGAIIKDRASAVKCRSLKTDWVLATVSFGLYFILLFLGKGYGGKYYYMQIAGLLPLIGFLYYLFKAVSHISIPQKNSLKIIHNSVLYLSSLTLEIYIVQFDLITDKFNAVFPLNTIVIFSIICIAAYALRILTSLCCLLYTSPSPRDA